MLFRSTILAKQLGISEHQLSYITHSNSGEGLLFYGSPEEAAAFGDGESDLSMMRAAGFGVAMGNAPENVRRRAPMVIGKNDEEGLLKRLKEIFKD